VPDGVAGEKASPLEKAILDSLDGLLLAFELEPLGEDRFRVVSEPGRFDRVFGGQMVAQALLGASATVSGKDPHSLHAYFAEAGDTTQPLDLAVERVRDGRSMSTRRVTVRQAESTLLILDASFHANRADPVVAPAAPSSPGPDGLPLLQDWVVDSMDARSWVDRPPPLELRIGEAPSFMGGPPGRDARSHYMRLPRDVGDDALLHTALLTYASDYLLLDMAFRGHPAMGLQPFVAFSLDHALWLHRPVRFERWHLHTQEMVALVGDRGLVRGAIHSEEGHLVATVMQEVLVRPVPRPPGE
jgi:acyl-CoA thioesterase-2